MEERKAEYVTSVSMALMNRNFGLAREKIAILQGNFPNEDYSGVLSEVNAELNLDTKIQ